MLKRTFVAASALLCSANLLAQTDIRQGMVAYWPLDQVLDPGTGLYTTPDVVAGQDFDLINMDPSALIEGRRGSALNFANPAESTAATAQYAVRFHDATQNAGLPIYRNPAFTVSFWVKATLPRQADRRVFSEGNSVVGSIANNRNPLFTLGTDSATTPSPSPTGSADLFIRNDGGTAIVNHAKTTAQPLDGNWHHVVYTDNNGQGVFYVDGVQDSTTTYTRSALTLNVTSLAAVIRDNVAAQFNGAIDDVALWERVLSAAEVQQLFNTGIPTPFTPQTAFFTQQPAATTQASLGHRVTFTATAVGTRPVTYQWFKGETPIDGATSQTLVINNVLASDAGTYRLQATTPGGASFSENAVLTVQADPAADVRNGLLSYWPLNSGTTETPDLYSGNDLTLVNMDETNFVPGQRGQALNFNVADPTGQEYAFRSKGSPIYVNPSYTVSFWVRANPQGDTRIISEASSATTNPLFGLGSFNNNAGLDVYIRNDDNAVQVNHRIGQRPVFDGNWHHVVWVDPNGAARLYVDGVLDPTDFTYTRGSLTPNTTALATVLRGGPGTAFFAGEVDELATWNRALTYTEIQELLNSGVPAPVGSLPAAITVHPVGADLYQGDRIILSAEATGTAPLEFQWLKNNQPIPGAASRTLLLSNVQPGDTGSYQLRVRNSAPEVALSNPAQVNVTAVTGLQTALVSYWPLDVLTTTTPDVINGNDLTALNLTEAALVPGKVGNAVQFDTAVSTTQALSRNHTTTPSIGLPISNHRAFSVAMWVNGLDPLTAQDRRVFAEASTPSTAPLFTLGTDSANTTTASLPFLDVLVRNANNSTIVNHRKSTLPVFDGQWRHIAYIDNNGVVNVYVDGVLEPSTDFNYVRSVIGATITSIGNVVRAAPVATAGFTGLIDEVAVWSRALSQVEVLNVVANGPQGGSGGGTIGVASIALDGANLRITVNTTIEPANLKIQSISTVDASNWTDVTGVTWTSEGNQRIATLPAPGSNRFYRVVGTTTPTAGGPTVVFNETFETGATGWTHGGVADAWELGAPTDGPGLAFSGRNVYATDLDGPTGPSSIQQLRSPVIDLTGVTSGRISWMEARDIETGDLGEILIKDADNPEALIASLATATGTRNSWNLRSFPIPAEALGRRIILEFSLTTNESDTTARQGWMIDDVQVIKN